ncbi:hypothetical protein X777_01802 [Ooceraea biroi]|uniref:Histone-lysine N-methyltransferase SETMAR n=1 Tax=Ooceraea biroi TaxID=2015173 RepID=A0A026WNG5_OOCBI|nr:hypothetical protein X777_01802 [Ooceraea biroi]
MCLTILDLGWKVFAHTAPYSPYLALLDYHLFQSIQYFVTGYYFQDVAEIRKNFFAKEFQIYSRDGKKS